MRWRRGGGNAGDMIDARGGGGGRRGGFGGGLGGLPMGRAGGGLGLAGVLVFLALQFFGGGGGFGGINNPLGGGGGAAVSDPIPAGQDPDKDLKDFTGYVFSNVQDVWQQIFTDRNQDYRRAKIVLFSGGVDTACGSASSAVGPFYCPGDQRVFMDLSFFGDMKTKLGGKGGDFAWAYVIAHEVGHHVQQITGTSNQVQEARRENSDDANELSVRLELQADCYAGVWAHSVFEAGDLEAGDVEEAIDAAGSVGDDRIQSRGGGGVDPESFTHGSSEQRISWFNKGREAGDPGDCDTFSVDEV